MDRHGRRRFLSWGLGGAAPGLGWRRAGRPAGAPAGDKLPEGKMPMRKLGRTGVDVSLIGLGGYHIGRRPTRRRDAHHPRGDRSRHQLHGQLLGLQRRRQRGRMGKALRDGYRKRVFLMTKIDGRDAQGGGRRRSIRACAVCGTDVIDLMQVHEVIRMEDPDRVFGPDGAMEALVAAKKAGKIRFIGFTGHKSPAHPPADAGGGRGARLHLRHRADAAQRDGRALPQLRAAGAAGRRAKRASACWG